MDGPRFDDLARALAAPRTRRGVLGALTGLAAGLVGARTAGAACPAGSQPCGGCVPSCPPDQVLGAGCRCLCKATGLVPGPHGCPCPSGQTRCNGVCVTTAADPANCGACGHVCPTAASGTCQGAAICRAGTCGFAPAAAGTVCQAADACHAAAACTGASTACPARTQVADGQQGGCPPCQVCQGGACAAKPCPASAPYCVNGACVACRSAGDCLQPSDPCHQATCTAGVCGTAALADNTACGTGLACCGGVCTDVTTTSNCGACGVGCGGATPFCGGGACVACRSASDCPTPADGCHQATCAAGVCGTVTVADNTSCGTGLACCGGVCTDVTTSTNCGTCGTTSTGGKTCQQGTCACPSGYSLCNNGMCHAPCDSGQDFNPDECICCGTGTKLCEGRCINSGKCCTDADCTAAGRCQQGTCYSSKPPGGTCQYTTIPDCCSATADYCQATNVCDISTCDPKTHTCVHSIKSCPGCTTCNLNDLAYGNCSGDLCRANNPCSGCGGINHDNCVANTFIYYQ